MPFLFCLSVCLYVHHRMMTCYITEFAIRTQSFSGSAHAHVQLTGQSGRNSPLHNKDRQHLGYNYSLTLTLHYHLFNWCFKAKIHCTSFPIASPQQVGDFPVTGFPKIHYTIFPVRYLPRSKSVTSWRGQKYMYVVSVVSFPKWSCWRHLDVTR